MLASSLFVSFCDFISMALHQPAGARPNRHTMSGIAGNEASSPSLGHLK
ncbi:hypothetical protein [Herbaspirillum sp.]